MGKNSGITARPRRLCTTVDIQSAVQKNSFRRTVPLSLFVCSVLPESSSSGCAACQTCTRTISPLLREGGAAAATLWGTDPYRISTRRCITYYSTVDAASHVCSNSHTLDVWHVLSKSLNFLSGSLASCQTLRPPDILSVVSFGDRLAADTRLLLSCRCCLAIYLHIFGNCDCFCLPLPLRSDLVPMSSILRPLGRCRCVHKNLSNLYISLVNNPFD